MSFNSNKIIMITCLLIEAIKLRLGVYSSILLDRLNLTCKHSSFSLELKDLVRLIIA